LPIRKKRPFEAAMTKTMRKTILFSILSLLAVLLSGDYVQVSIEASIYSRPDKISNPMETVKVGENLALQDEGKQVNGFYRILTSTSMDGWIHRNFVRRYRGTVPIAQVIPTDLDPFADRNYFYSDSEKEYATKHLKLGKPQAVFERAREGYTYCLDARLKVPLWVQYELSREDLNGPAERKDNFSADVKIPLPVRVANRDYGGTGYDKGHMAPAEDMTRNQKIMDESFSFSNMAPQLGIGFNRHIWAQLEAAIREWVNQKGTLTIITGPVFEAKYKEVRYKVIGPKNIAVPTHFYKIVVNANNPDRLEALAFLLPNRDLRGHEYGEYLVAIDEIEDITGLDFLSSLPAEIQSNIEDTKSSAVW
jgi:endonuclease G, mitochondrial